MKNKTVLVVDDNQDICDILYDWLTEECQFNVMMANSGNEALDILKDGNVNHVVTDINIPNGSGFDLLVGITKLGIQLDTIIVITGYSDIKEEDFRSKGADFFFQKPLDLIEMSEILVERSKNKTV